MTVNRLKGGLIDHTAPLRFTFDRRDYEGRAGDTLASALLANGVRLMGRSFKYHRPRGVLTAGSDEPNALVTLLRGELREPNTRATTVELFDGLVAESQNRWPGLRFDALAINDLLHPFFAAGFYYKTFMWPGALWEKLYEPMIRRAAGLGRLSEQDDPDCYDKGYQHCDLLIVGAGPAGLAAALTAGRSGARVILAEEDMRLGGRLLSETELFAGADADWLERVEAELRAMSNVRIMPRTTVVGSYDHGVYGALEKVSDHLPDRQMGRPRQTFWRIYPGRSLSAPARWNGRLPFTTTTAPASCLQVLCVPMSIAGPSRQRGGLPSFATMMTPIAPRAT